MDGRWNHVGGIRDHGSSQYPDLGGNNLIAQGGQEPYNKTRNGDQVQTYAARLLINVEVVCFNLAVPQRSTTWVNRSGVGFLGVLHRGCRMSAARSERMGSD